MIVTPFLDALLRRPSKLFEGSRCGAESGPSTEHHVGHGHGIGAVCRPLHSRAVRIAAGSTPESTLPWVQLLAATSEVEWPINPKVRRLTKCSSETYLKHARQFVAHFECSAEQLGAEHVRRWLRWQSSTKRLSPATLNVAIAALRHLFATLDRPDVMAGIGRVPARQRTVDVLTENEVERLLSATTNAKHRAMCALLYGAGLRISELQALETEDVDIERMFVYVRGCNTRPERTVPLSPQIMRAVREYWRSYWPTGQWLFPGRGPGRQMTRVGVSDAMRNCARDAGISKKLHPHLLRRSFAAHLHEHNTDGRTVQALLGIGRC